MTNPTATILQEIEEIYLAKLNETCKQYFQNAHIPSHDEMHHKRVWHHAKEMVTQLEKNGYHYDRAFLTELIIAIFFHDTGLVDDPGTEHGRHSARVCASYLKENRIVTAVQQAEILHAITHHDQKDYSLKKSHKQPDLLTILCVCDDLDAFGAIGILRYAEIYLLRGITIENLGPAVLANAKSRFLHFGNQYPYRNTLYLYHRDNYEYLRAFYHPSHLMNRSSCQCRIITMVKDLMIEQKWTMKKLCQAIVGIKDASFLNFTQRINKDI